MKAILFDFGNTIVRQDNFDWKKLEKAGLLNHIDLFGKRDIKSISLTKWAASFDRLVKMHEAPAHRYRTEISMPRIFQRLIHEYSLPSDITAFQLTQMFYLPICQSRLLFDDTAETLRRLKDKGLLTGLVSNTSIPGSLMDDVLERLQIKDFFLFTFYSSDLGFRKPDPDMFDLAATRLKLKPSQIMMVGDQPDEDIKGALDAGMKAVLIDRSGKIKNPPGKLSCRVISSLTELLTLLK